MADKIKKYYEEGLWSLSRVKQALSKGKITPQEFFEITDIIPEGYNVAIDVKNSDFLDNYYENHYFSEVK